MKSAAAAEGRVAAAFTGRAARADALVPISRTAGGPLRFAAALYRAQADLAAAVVAAHGQSRLRGQLERDLPAFRDAFTPLLQLAVGSGPSGSSSRTAASSASASS